jgi:dolichyl-diphosphooligosaccharide--protein glycosyltransferase
MLILFDEMIMVNKFLDFLKRFVKNEKAVIGFLLFLIFAFSLFLRIYFPWESVFSEPIKYAADDGVYHMRLVENMLLGGHFPQRIYFDAFTYFPYGTYIHFAPLYDWLLAIIIWLISLGKPTLEIINKIAPFYPAVLGGLTVLVVYFIGKELWDKWTGLFSSFLVSVSQPFLFRSLLGATDHHQAEVLFSSLAILFLILAFKTGRNLNKKRQFWIYTILAGVSLGLYFLTWIGALLFLFIIFVSIILYYLIEFNKGGNPDWVLIMGSIIFLITLGMIIPFFGHPDMVNSPLYNINHLASLLIGIGGFLITLFIGRFVRKKALKSWYLPGLLIFFGLLILFILSFVFPAAFLGIIDSFRAINLGFMSQHGELAWRGHARELIGEMSPMSIEGAIANFGYLFYLSFVGLGFIIYNFFKKRKPEDLLLIIWFLIIFLMCGILTTAFGQNRFGYYLSVNIALLAGFLGVKSLTFGIKNLRMCWQNKTFSFNNFQFLASFLLVFNILFFVFYPFPFNFVLPFPNNLPEVILGALNKAAYGAFGREPELYEVLEWLREKTPDTGVDYYGFYEEPNFNPKTGKIEQYNYPDSAYGVLASWDMGHMITYYSHRLPNANPFQQGLGRVVGEEVIPGETTFFIETNEDKAIKMLEQLKTKYIITDYDKAVGSGAFYGTQLWAVEDEGGYYLEKEEGEGMSTTRKHDKSMIVRLHLFDGREWFLKGKEEESKVDFLNHFRLVYESKTPAALGLFENPNEDDIKLFKIFEYVKGAKIRGNAPSGSEVEISTKIITNQGREFTYKKKFIVENGEFEFTVPYSTFGKDGWIENGTKFEVFASPYVLNIEGIEKQINISEEDVLEGNTIIFKYNNL